MSNNWGDLYDSDMGEVEGGSTSFGNDHHDHDHHTVWDKGGGRFSWDSRYDEDRDETDVWGEHSSFPDGEHWSGDSYGG